MNTKKLATAYYAINDFLNESQDLYETNAELAEFIETLASARDAIEDAVPEAELNAGSSEIRVQSLAGELIAYAYPVNESPGVGIAIEVDGEMMDLANAVVPETKEALDCILTDASSGRVADIILNTYEDPYTEDFTRQTVLRYNDVVAAFGGEPNNAVKKEEIYREVEMQYAIMDAAQQVRTFLEEHIEFNDDETDEEFDKRTKHIFDSFDLGYLAERFLEEKDCNVADNDIWQTIVEESYREMM